MILNGMEPLFSLNAVITKEVNGDARTMCGILRNRISCLVRFISGFSEITVFFLQNLDLNLIFIILNVLIWILFYL